MLPKLWGDVWAQLAGSNHRTSPASRATLPVARYHTPQNTKTAASVQDAEKFHPCPLTFGRWFGISAAAMTITDRRSFVPGDSPLTAPILSPGLVSVVYVGYLLSGRCFSSSAFQPFPREPF